MSHVLKKSICLNSTTCIFLIYTYHYISKHYDFPCAFILLLGFILLANRKITYKFSFAIITYKYLFFSTTDMINVTPTTEYHH